MQTCHFGTCSKRAQISWMCFHIQKSSHFSLETTYNFWWCRPSLWKTLRNAWVFFAGCIFQPPLRGGTFFFYYSSGGCCWDIDMVWSTFKRLVSRKLHPSKLTWNLQITQLKRKIIFQTSILGFHVNFRGCTCFWWPFLFSAPQKSPNRGKPTVVEGCVLLCLVPNCLTKGRLWSKVAVFAWSNVEVKK